jgi:hypothetical protein
VGSRANAPQKPMCLYTLSGVHVWRRFWRHLPSSNLVRAGVLDEDSLEQQSFCFVFMFFISKVSVPPRLQAWHGSARRLSAWNGTTGWRWRWRASMLSTLSQLLKLIGINPTS